MTFDELLQENYKMVGINYRPALELTEQQIDEIQQIFLDEGIGRSLTRIMLGGVGAGSTGYMFNMIGMTAAANLALFIHGLGLIAASALYPIAFFGAGMGAMAGIYIGGKLGLAKAKAIQNTDTDYTSGKLIEVTNKRDELLMKVAAAADQGKEDTASITKIEQLTKEQEKFGKKLQSAVRKDKADNLLSDEDSKKFIQVAKVAAKGKLTYIKTK